jgi:acyl-CoA thioester hydrolase
VANLTECRWANKLATMHLPQHQETVRPDWIDANGHMNLAYYVMVFDRATDVAFDALDIGAAYRKHTGNSSFVVETHTLYDQEVLEGELLRVTTRLLGVDAKRLHLFHEMFRSGPQARVAAQEIMCLHIDMATRRTAPFPSDRLDALKAVTRAHAALPPPQGVGRRIAMPHRPPAGTFDSHGGA